MMGRPLQGGCAFWVVAALLFSSNLVFGQDFCWRQLDGELSRHRASDAGWFDAYPIGDERVALVHLGERWPGEVTPTADGRLILTLPSSSDALRALAERIAAALSGSPTDDRLEQPVLREIEDRVWLTLVDLSGNRGLELVASYPIADRATLLSRSQAFLTNLDGQDDDELVVSILYDGPRESVCGAPQRLLTAVIDLDHPHIEFNHSCGCHFDRYGFAVLFDMRPADGVLELHGLASAFDDCYVGGDGLPYRDREAASDSCDMSSSTVRWFYDHGSDAYVGGTWGGDPVPPAPCRCR